jgi:hypothetical protein
VFNHIAISKTFMKAACSLAIALSTIGMGASSSRAGSDQSPRLNFTSISSVQPGSGSSYSRLPQTPGAPHLVTSAAYSIAQADRLLGQGEWCNITRECSDGLCCVPDSRVHPGRVGMCTRRFANSPCIPP